MFYLCDRCELVCCTAVFVEYFFRALTESALVSTGRPAANKRLLFSSEGQGRCSRQRLPQCTVTEMPRRKHSQTKASFWPLICQGDCEGQEITTKHALILSICLTKTSPADILCACYRKGLGILFVLFSDIQDPMNRLSLTALIRSPSIKKTKCHPRYNFMLHIVVHKLYVATTALG